LVLLLDEQCGYIRSPTPYSPEKSSHIFSILVACDSDVGWCLIKTYDQLTSKPIKN
jgi:hypothetical protein